MKILQKSYNLFRNRIIREIKKSKIFFVNVGPDTDSKIPVSYTVMFNLKNF